MPVVKPDIIQGNSGRRTVKGWEFSRVFTVSQLVGNGDAMLVEAVNATGIPLYGEAHPEIPTAFAIEHDPESISSTGNAVRVIVTYREFAQDYMIELGSRKLNVPITSYLPTATGPRTHMVLGYTYPSDYALNTALQGTTQYDGVEVEAQIFYPTISITRTEYTSISADALSGHAKGAKLTGEMLTDRGLKYNGRTNWKGWNLRPTDDAELWRCEITAASAENGLAYRVRYFFSFDILKWKFSATFKDPLTGEPVADVYGIIPAAHRPSPLPYGWPADNRMTQREFRIFGTQNFSLLELPV